MAIRFRGRGNPYLAWLLCVTLMLLIAALPGPARAETAGAAQKADLVLLLDRSGSMQKSDPDSLTATGAKVFLGMLDPADRVAVVAFDATARTLLPLTAVEDGAPARAAIDAMGKPGGQWTDIRGALQAAGALLEGQAGAGRQPAVLLFTDGRPEVQDGGDGLPPGYREELAAAVSRLAGRNIPVFTVGLGQGADYETMGQIARGTRAESFAATSSTQVVRLFQDVLSRIKERRVALSFEEDLAPGQAGQSHTFQVPPYTRLLTLSAVGQNVRMTGVGPGGTPLAQAPGVRASAGGNYQVYTVPNPAAGTWTVRLEGAGRVEGYGQTESAIRLGLLTPQPYSQVDISRPVPVEVAVAGDPDPQLPLEVTAASGDGVRMSTTLQRQGDRFTGQLTMTGGDLTLRATRAGAEVARQAFKLYTTGSAPISRGAAAEVGPVETHRLLNALVAFTGLLAAMALALAGGAWNWRRLRRREELLTGRMGHLSLAGCGRELRIGPGPSKAGPHIATLEARLTTKGWVPLAGLGLTRRELQISIRPAPGVRLQISGRPPGDGRLYHGDSVSLGGETHIYSNPQLARRPLRATNRGQTFVR
jgi:Mg-chelatase subunit ChlD